MTLAKFFAKYGGAAKPAPAIVERPPVAGAIEVDGVRGVVAFTDGDWVCWCCDAGVIHWTPRRFVDSGGGA